MLQRESIIRASLIVFQSLTMTILTGKTAGCYHLYIYIYLKHNTFAALRQD